MEFSQSKIMKILKIASLGSNFTSSYKKSINKGHTHTHTHTHTPNTQVSVKRDNIFELPSVEWNLNLYRKEIWSFLKVLAECNLEL